MNQLERSIPIWLLLLKVMEEGSINKAARALNMAQPALTRNMARLEQVIGAPLLDRSAKGVSLTAFGTLLAEHAQAISDEVQMTLAAIEALKGSCSSQLRLGVTPAVLGPFIPRALEAFRRDQPAVSVRIVEAGRDVLLAQLQRGELDLVAATIPTGLLDTEFRVQHLFSFALSVIARVDHPLFGQGLITLADLANCQWVLPPADPGFYRRLSRIFSRSGLIFPKAAVETGSPQAAKDLVIASDLLAIVPIHAIQPECAAGRLRELAGDWRLDRRHVGVFQRAGGQPGPGPTRLIALLKSQSG